MTENAERLAGASRRGDTMKAVVCDRASSPAELEVSEVDVPAMAEDEVLVRVRASSANPVDLFPLTAAGRAMGRWKRQILGTDFAGTVEAAGKLVTRFKPGDAVFGGAPGAFAEYLSVAEESPIVHQPAAVSFEQAGVLAVAGVTALQAVREHGRIESGQRVLINGASGGVGTFAVQIARALGAEVTAVCSPQNVDTARSIGADTVIDYTRDDFTRSAQRYDLMIDIAGNRPMRECVRVLAPNATVVVTGASALQLKRFGSMRAIGHLLGSRLLSAGRRQRVAVFIAKLNRADLEVMGDLVAAGKVVPVVDRRYVLSEIAHALDYMKGGHAKGKIGISISE